MQITRTQALLPLPPMQRDSTRERTAAENAALPVQSQGTQERRATRAIEDIQSAQRILSRQREQNPFGSVAQEGRQLRAAAVYQSLQQTDERAYVSEVLGIDVYA